MRRSAALLCFPPIAGIRAGTAFRSKRGFPMGPKGVSCQSYSEAYDSMTTGSSIVPSDCDERQVLASKQGVLQELERHGYVAEPPTAGSGSVTICRHAAAPNLLVRDDGRIELLSGQPD